MMVTPDFTGSISKKEIVETSGKNSNGNSKFKSYFLCST